MFKETCQLNFTILNRFDSFHQYGCWKICVIFNSSVHYFQVTVLRVGLRYNAVLVRKIILGRTTVMDIKSIDRAMQILFAFSIDDRLLGVSELGERLGLNISTANHLAGF